MPELDNPDAMYVSAASGWLDLDNVEEALAELNRVSPENRSHPEVLLLEWEVFAFQNDWEKAVAIADRLIASHPEHSQGWVKRAYALHELKRTQEAWDCLLPASRKFIEETLIPYNLACYACQLGHPTEALKWLRRAFHLAGKESFGRMALEDPDLQPLQHEIKRLLKSVD